MKNCTQTFVWWMSLPEDFLVATQHELSNAVEPLVEVKKLIRQLHLGLRMGGYIKGVTSCFTCDAQGNLTCKVDNVTPEIFKELLSSIHPYYRAPLVLLDIMQWSYEQVCQAMSLPKGNIAAALHYARRTLVPDFQQWDFPSNDLLIEFGAIVDGALDVTDEFTFRQMLQNDKRLEPYMRAVRELKKLCKVYATRFPNDEML